MKLTRNGVYSDNENQTQMQPIPIPETPFSCWSFNHFAASVHESLTEDFYSSQGKSVSSTRVQVKYPNPAGPNIAKSNSKKFRMTGLTASLAKFFTSSTRRSKRRRLSREYSVPLLASLEALRKRLSSSCGR
jgi:hypothetical protein